MCLVGRDLLYSNASSIQNLKEVACFTHTHVAQMVGYLNITGLDLALLLNFKRGCRKA